MKLGGESNRGEVHGRRRQKDAVMRKKTRTDKKKDVELLKSTLVRGVLEKRSVKRSNEDAMKTARRDDSFLDGGKK